MTDVMRIWNRDLSVVYVDSAAAGANTGASPTDALTTLPAHASLAATSVYLIRRGNTQTWTPGSNANARVAIMGMPLSSDPLYRLLPAAAISAWAGDGGTYCTLNVASGNLAFSHTGNYFWMHACDIVCPVTGTVFSTTNATFTFTTNNWTMTKCKYRTTGIDLTTVTAAPGRPLRHWKVTGNRAYCRDLDWSCCDIADGNAYSNGNTAWLTILGTDAIVERSVAIVTSCYSVNPFYFLRITGDRPRVQDVTVQLVACYSSLIGNIQCPAAVKVDTCMRPIVKDITATYLRMFSSNTAWTSQNFSTWSTGADGVICAVSFQAAEFSNWTVDFATNNAFTTTTWTGVLINLIGSSYYLNKKPSICDSFSAKLADAHTGGLTSAGSAAIHLALPGHVIVRSPIAWALNGVGLDASDANDPSGGNTGPAIENGSVKGKLKLSGGLRVHISTMSSTLSTASPHVSIVNSGTGSAYNSTFGMTECLIESLTLPVGQLTEQIAIDDSAVLAIETVNVSPVITQGTTILNRGMLCINNEAGVTGSFRCRTLDNEFKTVNAYRTGGASAALTSGRSRSPA